MTAAASEGSTPDSWRPEHAAGHCGWNTLVSRQPAGQTAVYGVASRRTTEPAAVRSTARANLEHCIRLSHAVGGSSVLLVIGTAQDGPDGPARAREEIARAIPLAASLGQRILVENVWNGLLYDPEGGRRQSVKPFADFIDSFASPWVGAFLDLGNHARYGDVAAWIRGRPAIASALRRTTGLSTGARRSSPEPSIDGRWTTSGRSSGFVRE